MWNAERHVAQSVGLTAAFPAHPVEQGRTMVKDFADVFENNTVHDLRHTNPSRHYGFKSLILHYRVGFAPITWPEPDHASRRCARIRRADRSSTPAQASF